MCVFVSRKILVTGIRHLRGCCGAQPGDCFAATRSSVSVTFGSRLLILGSPSSDMRAVRIVEASRVADTAAGSSLQTMFDGYGS
jgi:hypothetical protein